jgi:hypothetical protein
MRRTLALVIILGGATWATVAASGAGGPSPGVSFGSPGLVDADGKVRYVALPSGDGTTVAVLGARAGRVLRWGYVHGFFGVPTVAWDGSTSGLAHNGRRLVLATPPRYDSPTHFAVLDPRSLRVRSRILLRGAFAFDAISPGGSLMYLIQYLDARSGRYVVRAFNLNTRKLYAGAIVDRREPDEKMNGQPVTRAESRDGAWAYTLYGRTNKGPFVHALDTVHRRAFCVDLPLRTRANVISLVKMHVSGGELVLRLRGKTVARVDTRTFEVRR